MRYLAEHKAIFCVCNSINLIMSCVFTNAEPAITNAVPVVEEKPDYVL